MVFINNAKPARSWQDSSHCSKPASCLLKIQDLQLVSLNYKNYPPLQILFPIITSSSCGIICWSKYFNALNFKQKFLLCTHISQTLGYTSEHGTLINFLWLRAAQSIAAFGCPISQLSSKSLDTVGKAPFTFAKSTKTGVLVKSELRQKI